MEEVIVVFTSNPEVLVQEQSKYEKMGYKVEISSEGTYFRLAASIENEDTTKRTTAGH
jgi:hypothetical protein